MASQPRIKAAVIGTGFAGRVHVDALRRMPGVELVGVAASTAERSREAGEELGLPGAGVDELLEIADVVHNCTPNDLHLEIATRAVAAGAHLLVEKPLGRTVEEARKLRNVVSEAGRVGAVCFNYRYYAGVVRMRELIGEGELGPVVAVRGSYLQDWLLEATGTPWRRIAARTGPSCTIADLGTHLFDLVRHITGLEIESVTASVGSLLGDGDALDDHGSVLAALSNGGEGSFALSQVSAGHKNDLRIAVDCERGSIGWTQQNPEELRVTTRGRPSTIETRSPFDEQSRPIVELPAGHVEGWADAFRNLVHDFYAALNGRPNAQPPSLVEGVRAAELVDRTLASAAERSWVEVTGDPRGEQPGSERKSSTYAPTT